MRTIIPFSLSNTTCMLKPPSQYANTPHARGPPTRSGAHLTFIQLYATAPRMTPYLMDALLERVRTRALRTLCAAYSPLPLPVAWVAAQLGFETAGEAAEWALGVGAAVDAKKGELLTRESRAAAIGPPAPTP